MKINKILKNYIFVLFTSFMFFCSCSSDNKNISYEIDPLNSKTVSIKDIKKEDIKNISVSVGAKDADTVTYKVSKEDIKSIENVNGVSIPLKYLVADKKSDVKIDIELNDNTHIDKNIKIKVNLKNNKKFYRGNTIPDIKTAKRTDNENKNKLYFCDFRFVDSMRFFDKDKNKFEYKIMECPEFLYLDSYGNIRKTGTELGENIYLFEKKGYILERNFIYSKKRNTFFSIATAKNNNTRSDVIIEFNSNKDDIVNVINFSNILDVTREFVIDDNLKDGDWLHLNSLFYNEYDDTLIVSSRYHGVFKVTADGNIIWILSPHKGWNKPWKEKLLKAVDLYGKILNDDIQSGKENYVNGKYGFEWPYGQHSASMIDKENLIMFDNGVGRKYITGAANDYSRAVIYKIDEKNMTVSQIWQYGKELGKNFYSKAHGSVVLSDNNTCLINSGLIIDEKKQQSSAIIKEVKIDDSKDVIFELYIKFKNIYRKKNSKYDEIFEASVFYI